MVNKNIPKPPSYPVNHMKYILPKKDITSRHNKNKGNFGRPDKGKVWLSTKLGDKPCLCNCTTTS